MEAAIKHGQSESTITEQYVAEREEEDVQSVCGLGVITGICMILAYV